MANIYDISGLSYSPRENMEWFTRAMFGGSLISRGVIRAMVGVKGEELLSQIDLENKILQIDGKDCAWTPNQIIKLSEKRAKVSTYKINLEQCIDDLENKRTAYLLSPGAQNEQLPEELEDATLTLISIGLSNEIEELIIGGDSSKDPNAFDGMQTILLKSNEVKKVKIPKLKGDNIVESIELLYDSIKEEVIHSQQVMDGFNIFGSYGALRMLRKAVTKISNQTLYSDWSMDTTDPKNVRVYYCGVEFIPVKGIDKDTLIGISSSNAILLTDLLEDLENIELGQFPKPKESKVWIKGRLRLGFAIPFEDEAVILSPLVEDQEAKTFEDLRIVPTNLVFDVQGEAKTFTVVTLDKSAQIETNASGSGFEISQGQTQDGVTVVTVKATDQTGSIGVKEGQVLVKIKDTDRSATLMLEQRNSDSNKQVIE